jgi:uncharacterized membrane protein
MRFTSKVAELGAAAEAIGDYQRRVRALATDVPTERDDLLTAIVEAERSLGVAERAVRRAVKVASTS